MCNKKFWVVYDCAGNILDRIPEKEADNSMQAVELYTERKSIASSLMNEDELPQEQTYGE